MRLRPTSVLLSVAFGLAVVSALAACGSSTPGAKSSATQSVSMSPSASPTTPYQRQSPSTSPTVSGAVDLHVTDAIRAELLAAGAKEKSLTASDFLGLRAGLTYYAYDSVTQTYWAGAALVPNPNSEPAMVSVQDDGSYTLFHRQAGGAWVAGDTGMLGTAPADSPCGPVTPPAAVLAAWGWPPKTCHAPNR